MKRLPFPDRLFDVVTCHIAAHHFPRAVQAFAEARRVLVPGGRMILVDNYVPAEADELLNRVETLRDPSHFRVHTHSGWTRLLREGGFFDGDCPAAVGDARRSGGVVPKGKNPRSQAGRSPPPASGSTAAGAGSLFFDPLAEPAQLILRKGMWTAVR